MNGERWLITGSRKKGYSKQVFEHLDTCLATYRQFYVDDWIPDCIIHGACSDSADEYADKWAEMNTIPVERFPSTKGNYLKRNIEMVENDVTEVIAFWDGFSYGTAHTISQALVHGLPVTVIELKK